MGISYLCKLFQGDPVCVACAYHAGQGEIASWLSDPEISDDGKTAVLTIGDKQLKVSSLKDGTFSVMKAEALKGAYEYDDSYSDIHKLTVKLDGVYKADICITLEPLTK